MKKLEIEIFLKSVELLGETVIADMCEIIDSKTYEYVLKSGECVDIVISSNDPDGQYHCLSDGAYFSVFPNELDPELWSVGTLVSYVQYYADNTESMKYEYDDAYKYDDCDCYDEWSDDSDRSCSSCPDDECTGHCFSCSYRSF